MRIDFYCQGGFANLSLIFNADTDDLPQEVAQGIAQLVDSSGVFELKQSDIPETPQGAADLVCYQLTLVDGERSKVLGCDDATAPDELRPLLTYLRELALARDSLSSWLAPLRAANPFRHTRD